MIEEWRVIEGWDGLYEVSSLGRIRSLPRTVVRSNGAVQRVPGKVRKTPVSVGGYLIVTLCRGGEKVTMNVHAIVARAFIGPRPDGMEVAHADGDGKNAAISNIRYATPKENDSDKIAHGTRPAGERNGHAILSDHVVREIRARHQSGKTSTSMAADYGVRPRAIQRVVRRERWAHVL